LPVIPGFARDNELIRHRFVELQRQHIIRIFNYFIVHGGFLRHCFHDKMSILSLELIEINPISGSLPGLLTMDN